MSTPEKPDPAWVAEQLARLDSMTLMNEADRERMRRAIINGTSTGFRQFRPGDGPRGLARLKGVKPKTPRP